MAGSKNSKGVFLAAVLAACSRPYQQSFNSPILEARPSSQTTPEAIRVAIQPVTRENLPDFPELGRAAKWREPEPGSHQQGAPTPIRVQMVDRIATLALVPLPAFLVSVQNGSKQPLSFGSRIELVDNSRRQYRPIPDMPSLKSRLARDMFGTSPYLAADAGLMRIFSDALDELTILGSSVSIDPGTLWTGYLFFETGALGVDEYNLWMASVQSFTLRLKGSLEAGPEFVFNLDKHNQAVSLTCPAYVKAPSLERCRPTE
jgi:hypothetical protein